MELINNNKIKIKNVLYNSIQSDLVIARKKLNLITKEVENKRREKVDIQEYIDIEFENIEQVVYDFKKDSDFIESFLNEKKEKLELNISNFNDYSIEERIRLDELESTTNDNVKELNNELNNLNDNVDVLKIIKEDLIDETNKKEETLKILDLKVNLKEHELNGVENSLDINKETLKSLLQSIIKNEVLLQSKEDSYNSELEIKYRSLKHKEEELIKKERDINILMRRVTVYYKKYFPNQKINILQ